MSLQLHSWGHSFLFLISVSFLRPATWSVRHQWSTIGHTSSAVQRAFFLKNGGHDLKSISMLFNYVLDVLVKVTNCMKTKLWLWQTYKYITMPLFTDVITSFKLVVRSFTQSWTCHMCLYNTTSLSFRYPPPWPLLLSTLCLYSAHRVSYHAPSVFLKCPTWQNLGKKKRTLRIWVLDTCLTPGCDL